MTNRIHSSGWNAYLRRIDGETITITHPCHPLSGQLVRVLHYRLKSEQPSVVVELADLSVQCMPLSWTDRALPNPHDSCQQDGARLSGLALLEVVKLLEQWRGEG